MGSMLPSVEAGSVLAEMIPDGTRAARFEERFVVLQKVYRSGTNLLALAIKHQERNHTAVDSKTA